MATLEEKFRAAVNVVRGMPKEGPFQPSPELMLRFYAYFKQATEGPCSQPKPGFWEVVKKAKWDAWKKLGNMPKEESMQFYIDELKQIIEAMSYTENVASFMDVLGPFYEAVYDNQDGRKGAAKTSTDADAAENESGYSSSVTGPITEDIAEVEINEDIAEEVDEAPLTMVPATSMHSVYSSDNFYSDAESNDDDEYKDPLPEQQQTSRTVPTLSAEPHLALAVQRLQADLAAINTRLDKIEAFNRKQAAAASNGSLENSKHKRSTVEQTGSIAAQYDSLPQMFSFKAPEWLPFRDTTLPTTLAILAWPFVAQYIIHRLNKRHGK